MCDLNEELELLKNDKTVSNNTNEIFEPVVCDYEDNPTDAAILCDLWCDIQEYNGKQCIQCPELYASDPESSILCKLNQAKEILDYTMSNHTQSSNPLPVDCPYVDNPTSTDKLCGIWCEVVKYNDSQCIKCPNEYTADPEADKLCNLYSDIEHAMHPSNIILTTAFSGSFKPIVCQYKEHPTSANNLCNLWCQLQQYDFQECIKCPEMYMNLSQTDQICELNEELQILEYETNATTSSTTITDLTPVECQYKSEENNIELCEVWCQIQELKGFGCIECPGNFADDPEEAELCDLHAELILLQEYNETKPYESLDPIKCKYENNPTSADILCELWCDITKYDDTRCIKCPVEYINDPEEDILCSLYSDLEMEKYPSNLQITTSSPEDYEPVSCPYKDNPTSSARLCNLWCELQLHSGKKCIDCPYKNDPESKELCQLYEELELISFTAFDPTPSPENTEKVTCSYADNPTSADLLCELSCKIQHYKAKECIKCPDNYKNDPRADLLCSLNEEYELLKQKMSIPASANNITKVVCQYEMETVSRDKLCEIWCKIQPFKGQECIKCPEEYQNDVKSGLLCDLNKELTLIAQENVTPSPSTNKTKIVCDYKNDDTSADAICDLWCRIQEYNEKECIKCPDDFINDQKEQLLCDLNEELVLLENNNSVNIPTDELVPIPCQYDEDETSADKLCNVWCSIQKFNGKECIICPEKYVKDQEKEELCQLHETLEILKHNKSIDEIMQFDLEPVVCKFKENPTSAENLCDLWCQIQLYDGYSCINCPMELKSDLENNTLCDLYEELQILDYNDVLNTVDNVENLNPLVCIYKENPTSSDKLCDLWCQVESHFNNTCIVCPEEYTTDPASDDLCLLHEKLELLKGNDTVDNTISNSSKPITCDYDDHQTSSAELCKLWCQIKAFEDERCIICPVNYLNDPEYKTLCQLNEEKELLDYQNPDGPILNNPLPVKCKYSNNPTSSDSLCNIWCNNIRYNNSECVQCPSEYEFDPRSSLLCDLYTELQIKKHPSKLQLTTVSQPVPITCLYQE